MPDAPTELKGRDLARRAGILCADVGFRQFLYARKGIRTAITEEGAAEAVRQHCRVSSRAHLDHDSKAARRWRDLEADFRNWERELV